MISLKHAGICMLAMAHPHSMAAENPTENKQEILETPRKNIEKISITGSRIKRVDAEGVAPVQIIGQEEIEASGYSTLSDVLRELPVSTHGAIREESGRGGSAASSVNLRGLGAQYTLVLIDGRRIPSDPVLEVVDIGEIPVAIVERIEILKEGASALYGSDAVGGVVNIITKKSFEGASVLMSQSISAEGGGNEQRIQLVGGTSWENTNVIVAASLRERTIIMARDRDYSAEGWSLNGNPGSFALLEKSSDSSGNDTYLQKGGYLADPNCINTEMNLKMTAGDNTYCQFNYAKTASTAPAVNQMALMTKIDHNINDNIKAYSIIKSSWRNSKWNYAPAPQRFDVTDPEAVSKIKNSLGLAGSHINPDAGDGLRILYRTTELGTRDTLVQENNHYGVVGLSGNMGDWDWDLSYSKGRTWRKELGENGYWLINSMQNLIKTGDYNPFDPNRNVNVLNTSRYEPWSLESSDIDQLNLVVSGDLLQLPAGPIGLAFGGSYIQEAYKVSADSATINDEVAGSSGSLGEGKRNFQSLFAETNLPITPNFEVGLAARFDDYNTLGQTTNPRLSMRYSMANLMLRASAGTGFRAPSLQAINDQGGYGYPAFIDAAVCENAKISGVADNIDFYCSQQQYRVDTTAATNLKPEKTTFMNIGAVYDFGNTLNGSIDAWTLQIKDRIGVPDYYLLTKAEFEGNTSYQNQGINIERANGDISTIIMPNANLSSSEIAGIDVALSSGIGSRSKLQFNWNLDTTYFIYYKEAAFEGQNPIDRINTVGRPQWKANNSFTITSLKHHTLAIVNRTIASTNKANENLGTIPMHNEVDAQYSFNNFGRGSLAVGATNLGNAKPPIDESQNPTVDVSLYSNIGQSYYVKLTQNF